MKRALSSAVFLLCLVTLGCQSGAEPVVETPATGGSGNSGEGGAGPDVGDRTDTPCTSDGACSDGVFCNGEETCQEGFCYLGVTPRCDDGIECTDDKCSHADNRCTFTPPDEDADGSSDAGCLDPDGAPLGDDCDDSDADRFPGNGERCDADRPGHDEDCDESTFGYLDNDIDGVVSAECCNAGADGDLICGGDCDDDNYRRYPNHPEICDDLDNDCDGGVDNKTKEVPWYPDADGDNYGLLASAGTLSCAPIDDHALRATDCDDTSASIHSAALEICDDIDNNCDGAVDEGGVCACAPEGNAQTCACDASSTGVRLCSGGLWGDCDCSECTEGAVDCIGGLLPRACEDGRWIVKDACRAPLDRCIEGLCVCPDDVPNCAVVDPGVDKIPPKVNSFSPAQGNTNVSINTAITVTFSEPMALASLQTGLVLTNDLGSSILGTVTLAGTEATFTPTTPLVFGMIYHFTAAAVVTDLAGNPLSPAFNFQFTTELGAVLPQTLTTPESPGSYLDPRLSVTNGGLIRALGVRSGTTERFELSFNGSIWTQGERVYTTGSDLAYATSDGTVPRMILEKLTSSVYRYDTAGIWPEVGTLLPATDSTSRSPVARANGSGDAFTFLHNQATGQLVLQRRAPNGTYDGGSVFAYPGIPSSRSGAISETGHLIAAAADNLRMVVIRTDSTKTAWAPVLQIDDDPRKVLEVAVAMSGAGVGTVAWIQQLMGDTQYYDQLQVQDVNSIEIYSSWVGSPAFAQGGHSNRHERAPQIGVDNGGNVHVAYLLASGELLTVFRKFNSGLGAEWRLSTTTDPVVSKYALRVAPNGKAVAVWTQKANPVGETLWSAAFSIQTMSWGLPHLLKADKDQVNALELEIDGNGKATLLYSTNTGTRYLQMQL